MIGDMLRFGPLVSSSGKQYVASVSKQVSHQRQVWNVAFTIIHFTNLISKFTNSCGRAGQGCVSLRAGSLNECCGHPLTNETSSIELTSKNCLYLVILCTGLMR